jgi:hypothetical protein
MVVGGNLCYSVRALMDLDLLVVSAVFRRVNHFDFLTERLMEMIAIPLRTCPNETKGNYLVTSRLLVNLHSL